MQFGSQISLPRAMKIPDAKAAVDKEWKKVETMPAWLNKVKSKKEVILEAQNDKIKLEPRLQKVLRQSRTPCDSVKDDSGRLRPK